MTPLHRLLPTLGIAVVALAALPRDAPADTPMTEAMPTKPPRGWNSFDAYDSRIDEAQFRACVEVIEERLLPHGWDHVVVDYLWFDPDPKGWDLPGYRHGNPHLPLDDEGRPLRRLAMDEHGLLLPPPERWPSAAGGQGFKPLADWVHAKGMKFGLHIMRGVPRQAYYDNTPILGSDASARDIAETDDTCLWCNYMYGIDPEADGAQAYYDAMMRLYASWGVDYVKADDLLYPVYAAGEIEMIQRAIQRSGRPMTLSLSPGAAPLGRARHVAAHSNLWRVSPDFWDRWTDLRRAFDLLDAWSPHRSPGRWPDADMIPFGRLSLGGRPEGPERDSRFTPNEHRTLMTLWSIAQSPLMWGGDPLADNLHCLEYLTNDEVLAVNEHAVDGRQVRINEWQAVWTAGDRRTDDLYVALFNLSDGESDVAFTLEHDAIRGEHRVRDLWRGADLGQATEEVAARLGPHDATLLRLSPVANDAND